MDFETILGGSRNNFRKRPRPEYGQEQRDTEIEATRTLNWGLVALRKLRTLALETDDTEVRQRALVEAHGFAEAMAAAVLAQRMSDTPSRLDPAFVAALEALHARHEGQEAGSGYGNSPQFSTRNLFNAADDILVKIEELAGSLDAPSHALTQEELREVLKEFLLWTNDLSIDAQKTFFAPGTAVGGILSGGSVFLELVRLIVARYGDPKLSLRTFVIAVDKHRKTAAFERHEDDASVQQVLVTDDMIHRGGTLLTAQAAAGEVFPNATIRSGFGTDAPGTFQRRLEAERIEELFGRFHEFGKLVEAGRDEEAMAAHADAEKYASTNGVPLSGGWARLKEVLDQRQSGAGQR